MSLGQLHNCPKCGRQHRAWTQVCHICRRKIKNYELVFEHWQDKERFEDTLARIRHEEKILRSRGYKPTEISVYEADMILKKI